ncbi:hypothetical protein ACU686_01725 [Yinghuangia aomiensis]
MGAVPTSAIAPASPDCKGRTNATSSSTTARHATSEETTIAGVCRSRRGSTTACGHSPKVSFGRRYGTGPDTRGPGTHA